jgi:hypothetical protein
MILNRLPKSAIRCAISDVIPAWPLTERSGLIDPTSAMRPQTQPGRVLYVTAATERKRKLVWYSFELLLLTQ